MDAGSVHCSMQVGVDALLVLAPSQRIALSVYAAPFCRPLCIASSAHWRLEGPPAAGNQDEGYVPLQQQFLVRAWICMLSCAAWLSYRPESALNQSVASHKHIVMYMQGHTATTGLFHLQQQAPQQIRPGQRQEVSFYGK